MLNVVVGLIFILLLFSLLTTTIMELFAGLFSLRGNNLEKAIKNMLDRDNNGTLFQAFKSNAMYKQFQSGEPGKEKPPSYLSPGSFSSILFETLSRMDVDKPVQENIDEVPDENLKLVLQQLNRESNGKLGGLKSKVEVWYSDVMDRASGWYKRKIQRILLVMGFLVAVTFNVDTISIYDKLARDPQTRLELATKARAFVGDNPDMTFDQKKEMDQFRSDIQQILNKDIHTLQNPLGIGWEAFRKEEIGTYTGLEKLLGWLVTALAISLGATFWFDMLKKLVNIRSTGNVPVVVKNIQTRTDDEEGGEAVYIKNVVG